MKSKIVIIILFIFCSLSINAQKNSGWKLAWAEEFNYTGLNFNRASKDLVGAAGFLISYIETISGCSLPLYTKNGPSIELIFQKTREIGEEGYVRNVSPNAIKIIAITKAGD